MSAIGSKADIPDRLAADDPKRTSVPMGDEAVGLNLAVQILLKNYIERA